MSFTKNRDMFIIKDPNHLLIVLEVSKVMEVFSWDQEYTTAQNRMIPKMTAPVQVKSLHLLRIFASVYKVEELEIKTIKTRKYLYRKYWIPFHCFIWIEPEVQSS